METPGTSREMLRAARPSLLRWFILMPILPFAIRTVREYERAVIFRLGRLAAVWGPGLVLLIPIVEQMQTVSLRIVTVAVKMDDRESLASAFRLASALRAQGLDVRVAGDGQGGPVVKVAGEGFLLSGVGGEARSLASVEAVAEALRESGRAPGTPGGAG